MLHTLSRSLPLAIRAVGTGKGQRVLYTSSSPALAMSETLAHRLGQGYLTAGYHLITYEIGEHVPYEEINGAQLPEDWRLFSSYSLSQPLGSDWYTRKETLLLRVPSAVVPVASTTGDFNGVVNATHPAYELLKERNREAFPFDERFCPGRSGAQGKPCRKGLAIK